MNNQPRVPDPETRARSVARMREICVAFDEQIAVLDKLSAQTGSVVKWNPFHQYSGQN
jgi:hypothetical protein